MKQIKYFVSQCLNVDVSSFGDTIDDAIGNLKEAVELYFEGEKEGAQFHSIGLTLIGEDIINA